MKHFILITILDGSIIMPLARIKAVRPITDADKLNVPTPSTFEWNKLTYSKRGMFYEKAMNGTGAWIQQDEFQQACNDMMLERYKPCSSVIELYDDDDIIAYFKTDTIYAQILCAQTNVK